MLDNQLVAPQPVPATKKNEAAEEMAHGRECKRPATKPGDSQQTNFHFHRFHVTPRNRKVGGITYYGDNVLVCLGKGKSHIRFRIPRGHDQGTFWYHAHLHGLTDDQVFRGLAGMIIVGDARRYLPTRFARVRQQILSFKDIQVTMSGANEAIPTDHDWCSRSARPTCSCPRRTASTCSCMRRGRASSC